MKDLFDIRRDFTLRSLDEKNVLPDPLSMFEQWFDEALQSDALEPNAMNLATSTPDGRPSSRVVLLKQIKKDGLVFFTSYDSRKAEQLAKNPYCALDFIWHELERQVRIEGRAEKLADFESDAYFEMRPLGSKLGAWASPQSKVIPDRLYLEDMITDFEQRFTGQDISRPENWGGYIVKPYLFEFWQGRSSRLHDRIQYKLTEDKTWRIERLAP